MESEEQNRESLWPPEHHVLEPTPPESGPVQSAESEPVQPSFDPPQIIKIPQQPSAQTECQVRGNVIPGQCSDSQNMQISNLNNIIVLR